MPGSSSSTSRPETLALDTFDEEMAVVCLCHCCAELMHGPRHVPWQPVGSLHDGLTVAKRADDSAPAGIRRKFSV